MPKTTITNFDPSRIPDVSEQATFHTDATYVFAHLAAEIIPKLNLNLDWVDAALGGDAETVLNALAALQQLLVGKFTEDGQATDADKLDGLQADQFWQKTEIVTEASHLDVLDTRAEGARPPDDYASPRLSAEFTDKITQGWHSALTVKGWHEDYHLWQLVGYAGKIGKEHLFVRFGKNNSWKPLRKLWHEGNDGAGSGLDADKLDGQEGAFYQNASNLNAGTLPAARLPKATQVQAEAGTDNTKLMTPLRTKQLIAVSDVHHGWGYVSPLTSFNDYSSTTFYHGLGAAPTKITLDLVCR